MKMGRIRIVGKMTWLVSGAGGRRFVVAQLFA